MAHIRHKWREFLKQCILLNSAATVISFTFNVAADGMQSFTLDEFTASIIFSNCIGPPVWFVVFWVSPHWSKNSFIVRLFKVTFWIFVATYLGNILTRLVFALINPEYLKLGIFPGWQSFLFSFAVALTIGFGLYFYEVSQSKLSQKDLDEQRAKTLATEAQLASLESRIHPHFLFNTLNSISVLMTENPLLADEMMENLSELLRYSLDSNSKSLVTLKQEIEITEKYLAMEKIRYADRLSYEIRCEPRYFQTKLPPLSLQTLVENSIKHVVSKTSEATTILVSVKEKGGKLQIEVSDFGKGFDGKELKQNHGLDNLQKRLQTLFGGEANLKIAGNGTVSLYLPK